MGKIQKAEVDPSVGPVTQPSCSWCFCSFMGWLKTRSQDHGRMTLLPSWMLGWLHPRKLVARVGLKVVVAPSKHVRCWSGMWPYALLKKGGEKRLYHLNQMAEPSLVHKFVFRESSSLHPLEKQLLGSATTITLPLPLQMLL